MTPSPDVLPPPQPVVYNHLDVNRLPDQLVQDEKIAPTLKAYDTALGLYRNKPDAVLTPALKAAKPMVEQIIQRVTAGGNRLYYSNRFRLSGTGRSFSFVEYLPVDDILDFLGEELKALERSPQDSAVQQQVVEIKGLIDELGLKADLMVNRLNKKPDRYSARVQQELRLMRNHHHSLLTGDDNHDFALAVQRVNARADLRINPSRRTIQTLAGQGRIVAPVAVPPVAPPLPPISPIAPPVVPPAAVITPSAPTPTPTPTTPPPPTAPPPYPIPTPPVAPVVPPPAAVVTPAVIPPEAAVAEAPESEEEVAPEAEHISIEDLRYDMAVINRSVDVRKRARELAETQLREEMKKGVWYNPMDWARKAGLRIFEEYHRQRYTGRALKQMLLNNNSYLQMDVVGDAITDAQKIHKIREQSESGTAKAEEAKKMLELQREGSITIEGQHVQEANAEVRSLFIDHLLKPILDDMTRLTAEQLNNVTNRTDEVRIRNENGVQKTLQRWIASAADDGIRAELQRDFPQVAALLEAPAIQDQLRALFGPEATHYRNIADFFASDVIDIAYQIESDRRDHHFAIDQLDAMLERTNVTLGNLTWAAETEANLNVADKIIAWSQAGKIRGYFLNPASVGAAVSIGSFVALRAPSIAGKFAHIWAPGIGGIAGGTLAAFRRSYDLKVDRAAHQVDRTYGAQAVTRADVDAQLHGASWMQKRLAEAGGAYRRADLEALAYDTKRAEDLINGIATTRSLDLSQANNQEILFRQLAEVRARMNFSASQKVDLIEYSGRENVEQSRLLLVKAIAEGRVALRRAGLTDDQIGNRLSVLTNEQQESYAVNRNQRDRAFLNYRISESVKAGAFGSVAGIAAGLGGEQLITWGRRAAELGIHGVSGESIGQNVSETNLEHIIRRVGELARGGKEEHIWQPFKLDLEQLYDTPGGGNITLSKGLQMYVDNNHNVTFIDRSTGNPISIPAGHIDEQGDMVFKGKLPESLQEDLRSLHFTVDEQTTEVAGSAVPDAGKEEFVPTHEDMTTGHKTLIPEGSMWVKDGENWDLVMAGDNTHTLLNDVIFNADGTISDWDHSSELAAGVYTGKLIEEKTGAMMEIVTPTGEWKEHGVNLDRYEWYSYDKAGSQGNELKLYTYKSGDTIRLSMHNMGTAWQTGLDPREIHVPDVYKGLPTPGGEAGFAFSLPGHLKEPIIALANSDGLLDLNPNDINPTHMMNYIDTDGSVKQMQLGQFSKMVLNYDAYSGLEDGNIATELNGRFNVWKVGRNDEFGFISAGRYVEQDGQQVWQSFATIRGKGEVGAITTETIKRVFEPAKINLARPIEPVYETVTDVTVPRESIPIAVPFVPRYPLESYGDLSLYEMPLGAYYGGENIVSAREWIRTRPQGYKPYTKRVNADGSVTWIDETGNIVRRDTTREKNTITRFMNELRTADPAHYQLLEHLNTQVPAMNVQTRVAINIPAWMEGETIYSVLEKYTKQVDVNGAELNPDLYEINIIVNRKTGTTPDNTVAEIERFKTAAAALGKNYKINYVDVEFDPPFNNVGNARRVITNLVLMRSLQRPNQSGPLYIESEDADLLNVDPKTVINIIKKMDENPHLDAVRGIQDRAPEIMMENDFLFMYRRIWDFTESVARRRKFRIEINPKGSNYTWNRVITGGWNTAYSAEAYALIGGYNPYMTKGEDMIIGERMSMARGDKMFPNTEVIGKVATRSDSSPRRFIHEIATGKAAYGEAFEDPVANAEMRNETPDQLIKRILPYARISSTNEPMFASMINNQFQAVKVMTPNEVEAKKVFKFILVAMGFKENDYEFLPTGNIQINDWTNVKQALDDYRARHTRARQPGERVKYRMT